MPITHEQAKMGRGKVVVGRRHENDKFKIMMRQHNMNFMEADLNNDGVIDEYEFFMALPVHVKKAHTEEEIKGWFKMLDRDGSGRIDREEHLRWSLNAAALASGADIRKAFAKYDRDHSGTLTELEFCRAARDVGVGDHAEQLFRTLPGSEDGEVRYMDLVEAAGDKSKFTPNEVKGFIIAMAWDTTKDSNDVDTSGWSFTADDVEGFRRALADLLAEHKVRLSKIFEKIDRDDDNLVDHSEFVAVCKGMLGYQGKDEVLDAAFQELDDDRSGHVQFDEISSWLEGKATAKQMRMQKVGERARARARTTRIYNRSTTTRTCPPRTLLPALDDLLASRCVCTVACACMCLPAGAEYEAGRAAVWSGGQRWVLEP